MDLGRCKRVLLFGGSFDPPHVAHVALPLLAANKIGADAVAYIPAGQAPHKRAGSQTPAHHRLAMLRLALESVPQAFVLTDEIDRTADGKPSFTVDTLETLRKRWGDKVEMRLLIGADMMRIFPTWRNPKRITELAEPVVMVRPPDTRESLLGSLPLSDQAIWESRLVELPQMDVSSSEIRSRVARDELITGWVAPSVEDYIRREGLYRAGYSRLSNSSL